MSKGSKQRPTDMQSYRDNYDRIFGKPVKPSFSDMLPTAEQAEKALRRLSKAMASAGAKNENKN